MSMKGNHQSVAPRTLFGFGDWKLWVWGGAPIWAPIGLVLVLGGCLEIGKRQSWLVTSQRHSLCLIFDGHKIPAWLKMLTVWDQN